MLTWHQPRHHCCNWVCLVIHHTTRGIVLSIQLFHAHFWALLDSHKPREVATAQTTPGPEPWADLTFTTFHSFWSYFLKSSSEHFLQRDWPSLSTFSCYLFGKAQHRDRLQSPAGLSWLIYSRHKLMTKGWCPREDLHPSLTQQLTLFSGPL